MLKHLMNGGSLLSYALFDAESESKAARDAQRAELLKNNTTISKEESETPENSETDPKDEDDDKNADLDSDLDPDPDPKDEENLTDEEKEAKEKEAAKIAKDSAKAQRKQDRMQRRIDDALIAAKTAKEELEAYKKANPDSKLTEEEVEARANAKTAEKLAAKEVEDLQTAFNNTCEKLQKAATKIDPQFYDKIVDITDQFGPIPSFMIGVVDDFDNGDEVLAHIANDDELAEKIWDLKTKPAKMAKELVLISNKLAEDKKNKTKRQISRVPDPPTPVTGSRVQTTVITSADTKPENMDNYVKKRRMQIEENRKAGR